MTEIELSVRGSRVLVQAETQTEYEQSSGLVLIESYAPEVIGRVVAIGGDVLDVKPGDVVLFTPQAGTEMEFGGVTYLVLDEDEILLTWDEDQEPV